MSAARVASLRRYPVKSMGGEELPSVAVTPAGIPGDRGWRLVETATGRPASAKRHAALMMCRARYLEEPVAGRELPPAEITLPDETKMRTDEGKASELFSRLLGTEVEFVSAIHGAFDAKPLHLLTTATLDGFAGSTRLDFDARRFRPNIVVAVDGSPRIEDSWVGKIIRAGALDLAVTKTVKRCVMTTHPQPGLTAERGIFDAVFAAGGALGVYAEARTDGTLRAGDAVVSAI